MSGLSGGVWGQPISAQPTAGGQGQPRSFLPGGSQPPQRVTVLYWLLLRWELKNSHPLEERLLHNMLPLSTLLLLFCPVVHVA
ncbi:hypothetical protein EYF80_048334 [Liparis tanakae]|uniref:Uncharacterized protein n=1 Tax=Liparis tanakae TaxID=230148 RepID=A0A4Z2FKK9_9TELE|nr:hypothetical protein EYF80_048334 [Liparis tanakae]